MGGFVALITLNRDGNKYILAGSALCEPHPLKIEKNRTLNVVYLACHQFKT